jgi:hypothetical protein
MMGMTPTGDVRDAQAVPGRIVRRNGVVDPKPIASMGRADRLAMSFAKRWSLKNYENNKPW